MVEGWDLIIKKLFRKNVIFCKVIEDKFDIWDYKCKLVIWKVKLFVKVC